MHSNGPQVGTGYGQQTALLVPRLAALGHEVAISAFHGQQGSMGEWRGHVVYPAGMHPYGGDVVGMHARHFKADLVLTLMDQWALPAETLVGAPFRVACWMPVDCNPLGTYDHDALVDKKNAVPIALTRFGQLMLEESGHPALYVPHGVDTSLWVPPQDRKALRQAMKVDDKFVIFMNSANLDKFRKGYAEQFAAFARFHRHHPDTVLVVHAIEHTPSGLNLRNLAARLGISDAVKFNSQYLITAGLIGPEQLRGSYGMADLFSACSLAEGFGIPIVEAMSCFPADVHVTAMGVTRAMTRFYTGEMISLATARGDSITATPEHPFWTSRGWVPAGQLLCGDSLLYTGGHATSGIQQVQSGRIGAVVSALQSDDAAADSGPDGQDLQLRASPGSSPGTHQTARGLAGLAPSHGHFRAGRLHGGADRWRRNRLDPAHGREAQPEAALPHLQHVLAADGVVASHLLRPVRLRRTGDVAPPTSPVLRLPRGWSQSLAAVPSAPSIHGHQGPADGMPDRVLPGTSDPGQVRPAESALPADGRYRLRPEYQPITSISRRAVRSVPVCNLTTESGTYTANGYLVHNCGVPVVTTDGSAMTEVSGNSWKVQGEPAWTPGHDAWWTRPSISGIVKVYEKAYERGAAYQEKRKTARAHALTYDVDKVFKEHWVPVLRKIMGGK